MYRIKNSFLVLITLVLTMVISCKDLDEININPNGVDPESAHPNLLMPTIITALANQVVQLGFGSIAGVMQHTQKDGWSSGHNDYDWDVRSNSWNSFYGILRNIDEFSKKSIDAELEFHQGVALIMKSYTYGLITDLWGDAPYSEALKGGEGVEYFKPVFDAQKDIYSGIIADLEKANILLSKSNDSYKDINSTQDVLFGGDASKWRKFANSLALRYYMRLSVKEPGIAEQGIGKITSQPSEYPIIMDMSDDASMSYVGNTKADSWPSNTLFDKGLSGSYFRTKLCSTLLEKLKELNDPRIMVWANKIEIPLVVEPTWEDNTDVIINGERHVAQNMVDNYEEKWNTSVNYETEYIGLPPSFKGASFFNLNPNLPQGEYNPHASQLSDMYKEVAGSLLLSRMMSASEVHFILSEAALYGWGSGTAEEHYAAGVEESLKAWGKGDDYDTYIAGASYSGIESIIQQKWIASWSAAAESWFDYRRTGLPDLQTGETAVREALPLRFYYHADEDIELNPENANAAIEKLVPTDFNKNDSKNSAWSKMWLLQGTSKPY